MSNDTQNFYGVLNQLRKGYTRSKMIAVAVKIGKWAEQSVISEDSLNCNLDDCTIHTRCMTRALEDTVFDVVQERIAKGEFSDTNDAWLFWQNENRALMDAQDGKKPRADVVDWDEHLTIQGYESAAKNDPRSRLI